jgi:predicted adenylyl cyclase CyaB
MKNDQNIEVEYKFKIENKDKLIALLEKMTSNKNFRQYQSNIMFDNPAGLMQITDGRIRIRTLGKTGNKTLTYKKPIAPENGAKREIEYEILFQDLNGQIERILEAMEFVPTTSYERYQTKWEINGVHITLDEYPYADLIEIEGEKEKIACLAKDLGFELNDSLTKPTDTLFQEWRKERGLLFKPHMRFNDYDK